MMRTTVHLNGRDLDVEYHDHGYEPDTNTQDIDWRFTEPDAPTELTEADEQCVYDQLVRIEPAEW